MNDYDTPEIRCSLRNLSRVTECCTLIPTPRFRLKISYFYSFRQDFHILAIDEMLKTWYALKGLVPQIMGN